jgi:hypothetical protein
VPTPFSSQPVHFQVVKWWSVCFQNGKHKICVYGSPCSLYKWSCLCPETLDIFYVIYLIVQGKPKSELHLCYDNSLTDMWRCNDFFLRSDKALTICGLQEFLVPFPFTTKQRLSPPVIFSPRFLATYIMFIPWWTVDERKLRVSHLHSVLWYRTGLLYAGSHTWY